MRRREENNALSSLAVVMQKVNAQEAIRKDSAELTQAEIALFEKKHKEEFSIQLFQMYDKYLERLEAEAQEAGRVLESMQPELKAAMEVVLEARRRRRSVELIREKQWEEHKKKNRKAQANELAFLNRRREAFFQEDIQDDRAMEEIQTTDERPRAPQSDPVADYYRSMGMEDPRKRK